MANKVNQKGFFEAPFDGMQSTAKARSRHTAPACLFEKHLLLAKSKNPSALSAAGLAASPLDGLFALVARRRGRHGEDLEEDPPRYESVVVGEKAEDEADP